MIRGVYWYLPACFAIVLCLCGEAYGDVSDAVRYFCHVRCQGDFSFEVQKQAGVCGVARDIYSCKCKQDKLDYVEVRVVQGHFVSSKPEALLIVWDSGVSHAGGEGHVLLLRLEKRVWSVLGLVDTIPQSEGTVVWSRGRRLVYCWSECHQGCCYGACESYVFSGKRVRTDMVPAVNRVLGVDKIDRIVVEGKRLFFFGVADLRRPGFGLSTECKRVTVSRTAAGVELSFWVDATNNGKVEHKALRFVWKQSMKWPQGDYSSKQYGCWGD